MNGWRGGEAGLGSLEDWYETLTRTPEGQDLLTITKTNEDHERRFREFMERESLKNLSASRYKCPDCAEPFVCSACPRCGKVSGKFPVEPYFSWSPCIVCGCPEGGNRYDGNGWSEWDQCVKEYEGVCGDCVLYAEYGWLGDSLQVWHCHSSPAHSSESK